MCEINCSGGCPECSPGDHSSHCVNLWKKSKDKCCSCGQEPLFKIGDKVYSLTHGWGKITYTDIKPNEIEVCHDFGSGYSYYPGYSYYQPDGRVIPNGNIVLFHDKPTIIPPKKKVKKWRWVFKNMIGNIFVSQDIIKYLTEEEAVKESINRGYTHKLKILWTEIEE